MILVIDTSTSAKVIETEFNESGGRVVIELDGYSSQPTAAWLMTFAVNANEWLEGDVNGRRRAEKRMYVGSNGGVFLKTLPKASF